MLHVFKLKLHWKLNISRSIVEFFKILLLNFHALIKINIGRGAVPPTPPLKPITQKIQK